MGSRCCRKSDNDCVLDTPAILATDTNYKVVQEEFKDLFVIEKIDMVDAAKHLVQVSLAKNHLFKAISQLDIGAIFKYFQLCAAEPNKFLYHQGSEGSLFFIINSGSVQVIVDGQLKSTLNREASFGDMAMFSGSKRECSIKTITKCSFWVLTKGNFLEILRNATQIYIDKLRNIISRGKFFSSLTDSQRESLARSSVFHKYAEGDIIIKQGDDGDSLFILISGTVVFQKNGQQMSRISTEGEIFGDSAMLTRSKRTATCYAAEVTEAATIDRKSLEFIFGENHCELLLRNIARRSITADPHLSFFDHNYILAMSEKLQWIKYENDDVALQANNNSKVFRVIATGSICSKVTQHNIGAFEVIGLNNLNHKKLKNEDYLAVGPTIIGELNIELIESSLGLPYHELVNCLGLLKFIKKINIFSQLSLKSLKIICESSEKRIIQAEETIFLIDYPSDGLYIVKSGTIAILKETKIMRLIGKNEIFGERCIFENRRSASAYAHDRSELLMIPKAVLIDLPERKILKMEVSRKKYYQNDIRFESLIAIFEYAQQTSERIHFCARHPSDMLIYDLYIIPKHTLKTKDQCIQLAKEKQMQLQLDHRLIVKLATATHDDLNVYFITEHIKGCNLRNLIPTTEAYCKILALYLSSLLEYLHEKNIIYRELNPDSIIISTKGFPYLYKFSSAKIIVDRTYSIVGNPSYMSPEMIVGVGYSNASDYWSLGVVLYEILYGMLPFGMKDDTPATVKYAKILKSELKFPDNKYELANSLISKLLIDRTIRIEGRAIAKDVWLSSLNSEKLLYMNTENEDVPNFLNINHAGKIMNESLESVLKVIII